MTTPNPLGGGIPAPQNPIEHALFHDWLSKNAQNDERAMWYSTRQGQPPDYDYYNAWKEQLSPSKDTAHWSDKWKFPWHPNFSDQSVYYQQGMGGKHWTNNQTNEFTPIQDTDSYIPKIPTTSTGVRG